MKRMCLCDNVDECRRCWLFHNDERYAKLWGDPTTPEDLPPKITSTAIPITEEQRLAFRDCEYRGEPTGEIIDKERCGCGNRNGMEVLTCNLHKEEITINPYDFTDRRSCHWCVINEEFKDD